MLQKTKTQSSPKRAKVFESIHATLTLRKVSKVIVFFQSSQDLHLRNRIIWLQI